MVSSWVMTVAPVVVSPEMDSNTASVMPSASGSQSRKGSAPKLPSTVQNRTTTRNPSRRCMSSLESRTGYHRASAQARVMSTESTNGTADSSG